MTASYIITDATAVEQDTAFDPLLYVDATGDGNVYHFRSGKKLLTGVPLCSGCDAPIADGPCDCVTIVRPRRVICGKSHPIWRVDPEAMTDAVHAVAGGL